MEKLSSELSNNSGNVSRLFVRRRCCLIDVVFGPMNFIFQTSFVTRMRTTPTVVGCKRCGDSNMSTWNCLFVSMLKTAYFVIDDLQRIDIPQKPLFQQKKIFDYQSNFIFFSAVPLNVFFCSLVERHMKMSRWYLKPRN